MKKYKGFALTEVLITMVIIGLLVVVARPMYKGYQVKTNRTIVQAELTRLSQTLHTNMVQNGVFSGVKPFTGTITSYTFPATNPVYSISLTLRNNADTGINAQGFTMTATPTERTMQAGDGVICINNEMQHYWVKGSKACALTNTSTWYGE